MLILYLWGTEEPTGIKWSAQWTYNCGQALGHLPGLFYFCEGNLCRWLLRRLAVEKPGERIVSDVINNHSWLENGLVGGPFLHRLVHRSGDADFLCIFLKPALENVAICHPCGASEQKAWIRLDETEPMVNSGAEDGSLYRTTRLTQQVPNSTEAGSQSAHITTQRI